MLCSTFLHFILGLASSGVLVTAPLVSGAAAASPLSFDCSLLVLIASFFYVLLFFALLGSKKSQCLLLSVLCPTLWHRGHTGFSFGGIVCSQDRILLLQWRSLCHMAPAYLKKWIEWVEWPLSCSSRVHDVPASSNDRSRVLQGFTMFRPFRMTALVFFNGSRCSGLFESCIILHSSFCSGQWQQDPAMQVTTTRIKRW